MIQSEKLQKGMNSLLDHLHSQIEFAGSPKSAFLDNASEDALNIELLVEAIDPRGLGEDFDDLSKQVNSLRSVKIDFNKHKDDLLDEIDDYKSHFISSTEKVD